MKCAVCQKETENKTCSNACRVKLSRMNKKGYVTADTPEEVKGVTKTDAMFEFVRPNYYVYEEETYARYCLQCKKDFTTQARFRKTCSPDCESTLLTRLTGMAE